MNFRLNCSLITFLFIVKDAISKDNTKSTEWYNNKNSNKQTKDLGFGGEEWHKMSKEHSRSQISMILEKK